MSKYNQKFNRIYKLAVSLCLIVLMFLTVSFPSLADKNENQLMGLDNYLNDTNGVDYFGYEIKVAEVDLNNAKKILDYITTLLKKATIYDEYIKIMEDDLPDELKGMVKSKKGIWGETKSITFYDPNLKDGYLLGQGYLTITLNGPISLDRQSVLIQNRTRLNRFIEKQEKQVKSLRTIYRGFTVVGSASVKGAKLDGTKNPTFTVGTLSQSTILDHFRVATRDLYVTSGKIDDAIEDENAPSKFEKEIAEPIGKGAFNLYLWMSNWNIDLTMDGLIFGRMSPLYNGTVDFTHFGMEVNNPYGIIAAASYYVLRRILLGVLPVIMMGLLFRQLFNNGQKGRALLKETMGNFVLVIVLSFVAPYLIEICITIRDGIIKYVALGMGTILSAVDLGSGTASSVIGLIYVTFKRNPTLLNALVWAASVGSGFFYLATYIRIAMLLTGCVAILPIILFISIWNRKILKDWWNVFFPNLCVPLIDLILLQLPSVILLLFKEKVKNGGGSGGSMILGIIIIIIMWNSMIIRDRVVKLLGFDSLKRAPGLLATAAKMLRDAAKNIKPSEKGKNLGSYASKETHTSSGSEKFEEAMNGERKNLQEEALQGISTGGSSSGNQSNNHSAGGATDEYLNNQNGSASEGESTQSAENKNDEATAANGNNVNETTAEGTAPVNEATGDFAASMIDDPMSRFNAVGNRYDNLAKMDSYKAKIQENENAMRGTGYNRNTYQHDRSALEKNSKQLDEKMKESLKRMNGNRNHSSAKWQRESAQYQELSRQKSDTNNKIADLDRGAALDKENGMYKDEVARRSQVEQAYGRAWDIGGMNSKTYNNAKDFEIQTKIDNAKKKFATYKDFDSKQYEGILSPAEKESFYRERAVHEKRAKTVQALATGGKIIAGAATTAAGAAALTAGVAGVALSAYGGSENMVAAASVAKRGADSLGYQTANLGRHAGRAIADMYINAPVKKQE